MRPYRASLSTSESEHGTLSEHLFWIILDITGIPNNNIPWVRYKCNTIDIGMLE